MTLRGAAQVRALVVVALLVATIATGKWTWDRFVRPSPDASLAGPTAAYSAQTMAQIQTALAEQAALARQSLARQSTAQTSAANATEAPPQVRVVTEQPASLDLAITLPSGEVVNETISLQPDQPYQPTPAERAAQSAQSRQVFGARFRIESEGHRLVLSYVVPTRLLPAELRERLYGKRAETAGFHLFSAAWAQSGMGLWTGVMTGMDMGNYSSDMVKGTKAFTKLASNAEKIGKALDTSDQFAHWMEQLDALENCARNPTHKVTQDAYQNNPGYQQQTIDAIGQARSEVKQATGLSYVNQEANVGMQLTHAPGILTQMTKAVSSWNDSALTDIGNGLVADASKLVDCDLAAPPPAAGDGTITYHLHREGFFGIDVDDQLVKSTFVISSVPVMAPPGANPIELRGQGEFKGKIVSKQSNTCTGTAGVRGDGVYGHLKISGGADSGQCSGARFEDAARNAAFTCEFEGVDPVNGGKYQAQAAGEFAAWTECTLDLKPQQK